MSQPIFDKTKGPTRGNEQAVFDNAVAATVLILTDHNDQKGSGGVISTDGQVHKLARAGRSQPHRRAVQTHTGRYQQHASRLVGQRYSRR